MTTPTRKPYLTDLTDDQWHILQPLIPPAKLERFSIACTVSTGHHRATTEAGWHEPVHRYENRSRLSGSPTERRRLGRKIDTTDRHLIIVR